LADIDVIAEGIETPEQLEFVRSTQCRRGQGFYFARPLPAEAIDGLLHRGLPTEVRGQMNDRLWVVR
jgi:EAL domain-containing protein (putative c-di-GMP-specific phosphodiesterase class I)